MNISIVGTGYVGLCTGVGFALKGNKVICIDIDKEKVDAINNGIAPIYEKGLEEKLREVLNNGSFEATIDLAHAINNSDVTFIAVGTPSKKDGSMDMKYIETASEQINEVLKNKNSYHVVVVKSTVVPGTTDDVVIKNINASDVGFCVNPEFLREGFALDDFMNPDRIVIGEHDKKSGDVLDGLYENFDAPILRMGIKTAELVKYASNAFLATKISFINEIGNICKKLDIDVYDVAKAMGHDKRISPDFLNAGVGFGGSCFPKDIEAIVNKAKEMNCEAKILGGVIEVNKNQRLRIIDLLRTKTEISGKKIAILGLAFKPGTDDVRDSVSIEIINKLIKEGASVHVYDPKAMANMQKIFSDINYTDNTQDALQDADACLILTDWDEFKSLTDNDFSKMKQKIIIEGRRTLNKNKVSDFEGICW